MWGREWPSNLASFARLLPTYCVSVIDLLQFTKMGCRHRQPILSVLTVLTTVVNIDDLPNCLSAAHHRLHSLHRLRATQLINAWSTHPT